MDITQVQQVVTKAAWGTTTLRLSSGVQLNVLSLPSRSLLKSKYELVVC